LASNIETKHTGANTTSRTQQTHLTGLRRARSLALTLAVCASATLATTGSSGSALAFEPNIEAAQPFPPGPTEQGLSVSPGTPDFLPGPSVVAPET
jgi:hypothetical protein